VASPKGRWDLANFNNKQPGESVALFDAFGITNRLGPAQYPTMGPEFAQAGGFLGIPMQSFAPQAGTAQDQGVNAKTSKGKYSFNQLEDLWVKAGGNPAKKAIAAAIALAESAGVSNAVNHNSNGSTDRGLWQINSVHGSQSTFDPLANAKAAVAISSNGTNWRPWVTYNNGAYKQFMP
jgi:hypothetical protein